MGRREAGGSTAVSRRAVDVWVHADGSLHAAAVGASPVYVTCPHAPVAGTSTESAPVDKRKRALPTTERLQASPVDTLLHPGDILHLLPDRAMYEVRVAACGHARTSAPPSTAGQASGEQEDEEAVRGQHGSRLADCAILLCPAVGLLGQASLTAWRAGCEKAGALLRTDPPPRALQPQGEHGVQGPQEVGRADSPTVDPLLALASAPTGTWASGRHARLAACAWLWSWAGERRVVLLFHDSASLWQAAQWWGKYSNAPLPYSSNIEKDSPLRLPFAERGGSSTSSSSEGSEGEAGLHGVKRAPSGQATTLQYCVEYHSTDWLVHALRSILRYGPSAPAPGPGEYVWAATYRGLPVGARARVSATGEPEVQSSRQSSGQVSAGSKSSPSPPGMRYVMQQAGGLPHLYHGLADEAGRWGADVHAPPMQCPFTRAEIVRSCGKLLRLYPWLVVITDESEPGEEGGGDDASTESSSRSRSGNGGGMYRTLHSGKGAAIGSGSSTRATAAGVDPHEAVLLSLHARLAPPTSGRTTVQGGQDKDADAEDPGQVSNDQQDAAGSGRDESALARLAAVRVNPFGVSEGENLNTHLTEPLKVLMRSYRLLGHGKAGEADMKAKAMEAVVGTLTSLPYTVRCKEDVVGLPGFGVRTLEKIEEILSTGALQTVTELQASEEYATLCLFDEVLWAGPTTARRWYAQGYRTLEQVQAAGERVCSHQQRVGLAYYDELQSRASRDTCEAVAAWVAAECQACIPGSLCVLGGSYRRGQPTSADYDFICAPPPPYGTYDLLPRLYKRLHAAGVLSDDLLMTWGGSEHGRPVDNSPPDLAFSIFSHAPPPGKALAWIQEHGMPGLDGVTQLDSLYAPTFRAPKPAPTTSSTGSSDSGTGRSKSMRREVEESHTGLTIPGSVEQQDAGEPAAGQVDPMEAVGPGHEHPWGQLTAAGARPHDDYSTGETASKYFGIWYDEQGVSLAHDVEERQSHRPVHRRIDLIAFHHRQAPFALLSWTGNTPFNRSVREYVDKLGYTLDDKALVHKMAKQDIAHDSYAVTGEWRGAKKRDRWDTEARPVTGVPCTSEVDVFSFLGLRYIPANERNCFATFREAGGVGSMTHGHGAATHRREEGTPMTTS